VLLVTGVAPAAAADQSPWDSAIDPVTQAPFIPVELWTGENWDGKKQLTMSSAETRFGDRLNKDIKGSMEWKHPMTGETLVVYERTNQERDGVQLQLFAMNEEKTGLGRVYDSRTELGMRTFTGGSSSHSVIGSKERPSKWLKRATRGPGSRPESSPLRSRSWISLIKVSFTVWSSSGSIKNLGARKSSTIRRILIAPIRGW
jgi:hypothetical protein